MSRFAAGAVLLLALLPVLLRSAEADRPARRATRAVDPSVRYDRLICLVHLKGSGKHGDPVRPEFLPAPGDPPSRAGILAWSMQLTDDKNMAILHLVAADRKAFDPILNDKRPEIRVFEIGRHGRNAIEQEMKKYKKDFSLDNFRVVAQ